MNIQEALLVICVITASTVFTIAAGFLVVMELKDVLQILWRKINGDKIYSAHR